EDTAGHEWKLERDILGRILLEVDPFHRRRHFEHDVSGRMTAYRDESGQTVDLTYHPGGLLKSRQYADGTEERFEYDPAGRLVKAENAVCTVYCQYDPLGRLVGEASDAGSHRASYDPTGRLVARHADGGATFRWEYHPDGQISGISMDDAALLSVGAEQRG